MRRRERFISSFFKMLEGIAVELFATVVMMAVIFITGVVVLRWFSR